MQLLNIAGYKFTTLSELPELRERLLAECRQLDLHGTILLSVEGINVSLVGLPERVETFKASLKQSPHFFDMTFRESVSAVPSFNRLKVKIKDEIIRMSRPEIRAEKVQAPHLSPVELKQWLDENRDVTILDTRNDYEVEFGTFDKAIHLNIKDFGEFPAAAEEQVAKDKPIVMFCTGGIRCEKAALHLLNAGYQDVYQLDGGILNYFSEVGGAHYQGDCFVFDQRIAVDPNLQTIIESQLENIN